MINKIISSLSQSVADIFDGASVLVSGFGGAGLPTELLEALYAQGAKNLTLISNNAGTGSNALANLIIGKRVKKMICSFPRQSKDWAFDEQYRLGEIELELVPQGTLAERIRAGGAGIGAFYTPTAFGTDLAVNKETRVIDGVPHVYESAIKADFSLIKAHQADRWGNLTYYGTGRNYGPVMATAAKCTIAQVNQIVDLGALHPEHIVTSGIYVQRVVSI